MNEPHTHHPQRHHRARWSLPLAEHPRLDLQTDIARVHVVPTAPGEAAFLEVTPDHAHAAPPVEVEGSRGTTRVRIAGTWAGDPSWWSGPWWEKSFWKKGFRVNVVAHLPPNVAGKIQSSAAKVTVAGLAGCDLAIGTDAGSLQIEDCSGVLRLATDAGRIDARRIAGSLDIATSAGAVTADVLSLAPGTHRIRTNVGAVRLELARGMPVRVVARTTMGATRIDFPTREDAPAVLDVEADLGAIRVVESSRTWDGAAVVAGGPYRTPTAAPARERHDEEIERILERVADGSLTPEAARDLLRALGVA
ncbi:MAG TPA: hypothetical protein VGH28_15140 [Polyangiaceae bacterium]|jgi:hypothetical protein